MRGKIDLFESGEIEKTLRDFDIELLAKLPFDIKAEHMAENGELFVSSESDISNEFNNIVRKVMK